MTFENARDCAFSDHTVLLHMPDLIELSQCDHNRVSMNCVKSVGPKASFDHSFEFVDVSNYILRLKEHCLFDSRSFLLDDKAESL